MSEAFDIYTLLFLVLAVVIFIRLRNVLGRRTGNERPPFDPYTAQDQKRPGAPKSNEPVVALPRGRPAPDADALLDHMLAAAGKFDVGKIRGEQIARTAAAGSD